MWKQTGKITVITSRESCSEWVGHHLAAERERTCCWRDPGAWRERNETSLSAASYPEPGGTRASESKSIPFPFHFWILNQEMNWWIDFLGAGCWTSENLSSANQQFLHNSDGSLEKIYVHGLHKSSQSLSSSLWKFLKDFCSVSHPTCLSFIKI